MSPKLLLLIAAAGATALSACAPVAKPDTDGAQTAGMGRQCFYVDDVDSFRADNQTLYVRSRQGDVFELQTISYCSDLDTTFGIAFLPGVGLSRLCTGDFSRVAMSGGPSPRTPCRVQVSKKLTPAEVEALPARNRP